VGEKKVAGVETVVVGTEQLRSFDPRIRGILGGTFLEHFDFLLDNQNRTLCLDDTGSLAASAKGQRVELENSLSEQKTSVAFTRPLVVSARLSAIQEPRILLLDSGSNSPLLFSEATPLQSRFRRTLKRVVNGVAQEFGILQSQEVRIGKTVLRGAEFAVPMNVVGSSGLSRQEDGVLPTAAFRRVFISSSKGYAVLEPWE
jgi:hypothetical protein